MTIRPPGIPLRSSLVLLLLGSSLVGGLVGCSFSETPRATQVLPPLSAQAPESPEPQLKSISFYYDGAKTSITIIDAAILFAASTLNTNDPVQIVNFVNNTLKVTPPITASNVTALGNPLQPAISDFTGDGKVDIKDAAVLFAAVSTGGQPTASKINTFLANTLKLSGVTVTQAQLDGFFSSATPTSTTTPTSTPTPTRAMALQLTSSAFSHSESIPARYTCEGEDLSPPLAWSGAPAGTQSFALIMDDPDAPGGTFVHWVVYNLPANVTSLPEGIRSDASLPQGAVHGQNSWGRRDYGGPCPPSGTHRYFFTLYALDRQLSLAPGATKEALLQAMEGHILAQAQLMGTYQKGRR